MAARKKAPPKQWGTGVGSSQFVWTGGREPLGSHPPVTALGLFSSWACVAIDSRGNGVTEAWLQARAVVGRPETMREEALVEALAEALLRLFDATDALEGMVTQKAYDDLQDELETAEDDKREAEKAHEECDETIDSLRDQIADLQRDLDAAKEK